MKSKLEYGQRLVVVGMVVGLMVAGAAPFARAQSNPNPGVLPPGSSAYGMTYGEWGARWVQWAMGQPLASNPIADTTGAFCHVGQAGPVWFLAGTFGGSVVRTCTVPVGKALFFPLINSFGFADPGESVDGLRTAINLRLDHVDILECSIDGVPLSNLFAYRAMSGPVFDVTLPPGNVFGVDPGLYPNWVTGGYWLLVAPLPAGNHVLHFHAHRTALPGFFGAFGTEVTYFLTVK